MRGPSCKNVQVNFEKYVVFFLKVGLFSAVIEPLQQTCYELRTTYGFCVVTFIVGIH